MRLFCGISMRGFFSLWAHLVIYCLFFFGWCSVKGSLFCHALVFYITTQFHNRNSPKPWGQSGLSCSCFIIASCLLFSWYASRFQDLTHLEASENSRWKLSRMEVFWKWSLVALRSGLRKIFKNKSLLIFFVWLYDKESQSENRWWVSSYKGEEGQGLYTIHT